MIKIIACNVWKIPKILIRKITNIFCTLKCIFDVSHSRLSILAEKGVHGHDNSWRTKSTLWSMRCSNCFLHQVISIARSMIFRFFVSLLMVALFWNILICNRAVVMRAVISYLHRVNLCSCWSQTLNSCHWQSMHGANRGQTWVYRIMATKILFAK